MTDPSKQTLFEYRRADFLAYVQWITDRGYRSEAERDAALDHFVAVVPHPAKSDLLYWPEEGADTSPEGITDEIERYCLANGIPAFKDSPRGRA